MVKQYNIYITDKVIKTNKTKQNKTKQNKTKQNKIHKRKVIKKMKTEQKNSKWTDWTEIDDNSMMGAMYKTNGKKIRVKFPDYDVVGESCCSKYDKFDLDFGIEMALLRCLVKVWEKKKVGIDDEIAMINTNIKKMIDSLYN